VRSEFTDKVLELRVDPIITGQMNHLTNEDGTRRWFRNVVGKIAAHFVQKPQTQETVLISRRKLKILYVKSLCPLTQGNGLDIH
jgi:hypothetical protein